MASQAAATEQRRPAHECIVLGLKSLLDGIAKDLKAPADDVKSRVRRSYGVTAAQQSMSAFLIILDHMTIPPNAIEYLVAALEALRVHPALAALRTFSGEENLPTDLEKTLDATLQLIRELAASHGPAES